MTDKVNWEIRIGDTYVDSGNFWMFMSEVWRSLRLRDRALVKAQREGLRSKATDVAVDNLLMRSQTNLERMDFLMQQAVEAGRFDRFCSVAWLYAVHCTRKSPDDVYIVEDVQITGAIGSNVEIECEKCGDTDGPLHGFVCANEIACALRAELRAYERRCWIGTGIK